MNKVIQFFIEVKAELSKVVWPSRKQTAYYTGIVIGMSIVIAVILGAADYGLLQALQKVVVK